MRPRLYWLFFLVFSCSEDDEPKIIYDVHAEFQPHVERFLLEAEARGHAITITNLIIKRGNTLSSTACGRCHIEPGNGQRTITITTTACWNNPEGLETLVFHELGHCILNRQHDGSTLPNGAPRSIMTPGDLTIYSPCVYQIGDAECNKLSRRSYYLDELFDETTPTPVWAK